MAKDKSVKDKPGKKTAGQARKLGDKPNHKNIWWGMVVIAIITFIAYIPVFSNDLIKFDDDVYIQHQVLIRSFDINALFSQFVMGNYHPFVMLVYTIIYHFYKANPVPYHTVNLLLHIINSGLVLWLMFYITESFPIAFIAGLLFGIHPLHVESVAWASELKDVMYAFGFLTSLICYVRYVKEKQPLRLYILSLLCFLFAVFSKAMAVSLVPVLFLFDFYLGRKFSLKTVIEKIPFFILSFIMGVVAIYAQKSTHSIFIKFTFFQRAIFACYGFITYIGRLFIPVNLCPYYFYPPKTGNGLPLQYYFYPPVLILLLAAVFYSLRKTKKIFFGIAFFTLTVFLVLQLLPVGKAITADRYTYIPSIGIFFLMAEGLLLIPGKKMKIFPLSPLSAGIAAVFILFFLYQANSTLKVWRDSDTFWTNIINSNSTSVAAVTNGYLNRGEGYMNEGKYIEAEDDFKQVIKLEPTSREGWDNLGGLYWLWAGKDPEHGAEFAAKAWEDVNKSIQLDSTFSLAYTNRATILYETGKRDEAMKDINKAIALDSTNDLAWLNRGDIYYQAGQTDLACMDFKKAASLGNANAANLCATECK